MTTATKEGPTSDLRGELADIAASVAAYVEWQLDTGAAGAPRETREAREARTAQKATAPAAPAAAPVATPVAPPDPTEDLDAPPDFPEPPPGFFDDGPSEETFSGTPERVLPATVAAHLTLPQEASS